MIMIFFNVVRPTDETKVDWFFHAYQGNQEEFDRFNKKIGEEGLGIFAFEGFVGMDPRMTTMMICALDDDEAKLEKFYKSVGIPILEGTGEQRIVVNQALEPGESASDAAGRSAKKYGVRFEVLEDERKTVVTKEGNWCQRDSQVAFIGPRENIRAMLNEDYAPRIGVKPSTPVQ